MNEHEKDMQAKFALIIETMKPADPETVAADLDEIDAALKEAKEDAPDA